MHALFAADRFPSAAKNLNKESISNEIFFHFAEYIFPTRVSSDARAGSIR